MLRVPSHSGSGFDPEEVDPEITPELPDLEDSPPEPEPEPAPIPIEITEERVRALLKAQGRTLHTTIGRTDRQWLWSDEELDEITPSLTRLAKRMAPLRKVAQASDAIVVGAVSAGYVIRNLTDQPEKPAEETEKHADTTIESGGEGLGDGTIPFAVPGAPSPGAPG